MSGHSRGTARSWCLGQCLGRGCRGFVSPCRSEGPGAGDGEGRRSRWGHPSHGEQGHPMGVPAVSARCWLCWWHGVPGIIPAVSPWVQPAPDGEVQPGSVKLQVEGKPHFCSLAVACVITVRSNSVCGLGFFWYLVYFLRDVAFILCGR